MPGGLKCSLPYLSPFPEIQDAFFLKECYNDYNHAFRGDDSLKNRRFWLADGLYMIGTLTAAFFVNLFLQTRFETQTMTPMVFVLGVFLVSWKTRGYFWGIAASLISVLAVNYTFTYPFWAFDLISPECISSAVVMLIVAILTGTLTTRIKQQERIRYEAETERMRSNLLRAVSHDLRTPLTAIYGACSVMIESYDDLSREKQLKLLDGVRNDSQWLVRMVENLLSVTRIDNQKVRIAKNETVLEELIDAVLVKFRKHYPKQKVHVQLPDVFVSIPMDAMLIQQVLMNLLENAVFHAHGMQNLWLRVEIHENRAVFSVEDDGCGIPAARMHNLFTGLQDSEAPTDNSRSNMGIGLSVCAAIVKAHGSEIIVRNRPTGGAQFTFALEMEEILNE